jgi:hypothetical protein
MGQPGPLNTTMECDIRCYFEDQESTGEPRQRLSAKSPNLDEKSPNRLQETSQRPDESYGQFGESEDRVVNDTSEHLGRLTLSRRKVEEEDFMDTDNE